MKFFSKFFLFLFFYVPLFSQDAQTLTKEQLQPLEFSLLTVSPGGMIFNSWGHTLLLLENKDLDSQIVFDYGRFIFEPFFLFNWLKGKPTYYVGSNLFEGELHLFEQEGRWVYRQKLFLNTEQKKIILKAIRHDMLPENRRFVYHHFEENCTTKVRDLLDDSLDSFLKEKYSNKLSGLRFRDLGVRQAKIPVTAKIVLHLFLGWQTDRSMNLYQTMFLPKNLMMLLDQSKEQLAEFYQSPMVGKIETIGYPFGVVQPPPLEDSLQKFDYAWFVLFALLFLMLLLYFFLLWKDKKIFTKTLFFLWSLFSSLLGLAILYANIIAVQPELQVNLNILVFNPLNIVLYFLYLFFEKKQSTKKRNFAFVAMIFFPLLSVFMRLFFFLPFAFFKQPTELFSIYVLLFYFLFGIKEKIINKENLLALPIVKS